jgi:hypothetical protein
MSHGSYDLNLGSEILILGRDIRSRSWPNIGGTYGNFVASVRKPEITQSDFFLVMAVIYRKKISRFP